MSATQQSLVITRKSHTTRVALMRAAREIFATEGFVKARVSDIAKLAEKSTGVFYIYFQDKEAIFSALIEEFEAHVNKTMPLKHEYEERIADATFRAISAFWAAYRDHLPELAGLFEVAQSNKKIMKVWKNIRVRGTRPFALRISEQQKVGKCLNVDPELGGSALHGMIEFACFNWHSEKLDFPERVISNELAVKTLFTIAARFLELDCSDQVPASAK